MFFGVEPHLHTTGVVVDKDGFVINVIRRFCVDINAGKGERNMCGSRTFRGRSVFSLLVVAAVRTVVAWMAFLATSPL
jgi:hypothetical protein